MVIKVFKDKKRRGWSSAVDNDELQVAVEKNPRTTICELAVKLNVSQQVVLNHLRPLGKTKKCDKRGPHELNDD